MFLIADVTSEFRAFNLFGRLMVTKATTVPSSQASTWMSSMGRTFSWGGPLSVVIAVFIDSAILRITGTTTEFPACLYKWEFATFFGVLNELPNPWNIKHSFGVNFRIPCDARINGTLCPPVPIFAVSVGQAFDLFSRTYFLRHWYIVSLFVIDSTNLS